MGKQSSLFPKATASRKKHIYTMDHIEDGYDPISNRNIQDAFKAMMKMYYLNSDNGLVAPSMNVFAHAMEQDDFYEITDNCKVARKIINP